MIDTLECSFSKKFLKSIFWVMKEEATAAVLKEKKQALNEVRIIPIFILYY